MDPGDGAIYVADSGNSCIRKISDNSVTSLVCGQGLSSPSGLALNQATKMLFIADREADAIFTFDLQSNTFSKIVFDSIYLRSPEKIAIHTTGHLIFTSTISHSIYFVLMGCGGNASIPCSCMSAENMFFGADSRQFCILQAGEEKNDNLLDGPLARALFDSPRGMAVLPSGSILLADAGNNAVRGIYLDSSTAESWSWNPYNFLKQLNEVSVTTILASSTALSLRGPSAVAFSTNTTEIFIADTK